MNHEKSPASLLQGGGAGKMLRLKMGQVIFFEAIKANALS